MEIVASSMRLSPRRVPMPLISEHLNSPPVLCKTHFVKQQLAPKITPRGKLSKSMEKKKFFERSATPSKKQAQTKGKRAKSVAPGQRQEKERNKERFENGKKVARSLFDKVRQKRPKAEERKRPLKGDGSKKALTVTELYKDITLKSPIIKLYVEVMQSPGGKPPEKIFIKDFMQFAKKISVDIYEKDIKDSFYYLAKATATGSPRGPKEGEEKWEEKLFILSGELGRKYDEYIAEEENLKGVLNVHTLKSRNYELQQKIAQWKSTLPQQKEIDKYYQSKGEYILSKLKEFSESTMLEKEELDRRTSAFYDLLDKKRALRWQFKTVMKFFSTVPITGVISLKDSKRHLENVAIQKLAEFSLLKSFIEQIKQRCTVDGRFFSFYDVPDVILTLKYGKREYDLVIKFLKKSKEEFLELKRTENGAAQITDDDVVPLSILDETLSKMRYKQERREQWINKVIFDCETEVDAKKTKLDVTKERVMQTIENNIFIAFLNGYLDGMLTELNLCLFIIKQIHKWISDPYFTFRANEFLAKFKALMSTPKTDPEFAKLNTVELDRFNQRKKVVDTTSEATAISALAPKTTEKPREVSSSGMIEEEVEEAIDVLNQPERKTEKVAVKSTDLRIEKPNLPQLEISEEPPIVKPEEGLLSKRSLESKKEDYEKELYKNLKGEYFDPTAKFGTLEKDYTEYDPRATKYEAVLPADFYMKTINKQTPEKKEKWFLRPHHIESLTKHPYSKWDNVMNTKYYSYYEAEKGKGAAKNKDEEMKEITQDLIETLEDQIDKLKARAYLSDQLKKHKADLGMEGKSLSLKSMKDKEVMGKIEQSVDEIRRQFAYY
eukprot:TRINITY_DN588_c0_g1_i1.p1 TRINITY_DN588_c0_g1~~TRINITY_DN588_c0_g1_i1.p1  ORF type:complete len:836 (-),score=158.30 TRINITY_DN588_c0_g1_i1:6480-8987(-)